MAAGLQVFDPTGKAIVDITTQGLSILGSFHCPGALGTYNYKIPDWTLASSANKFIFPSYEALHQMDNGGATLNMSLNQNTGQVIVKISSTTVPPFELYFGVI